MVARAVVLLVIAVGMGIGRTGMRGRGREGGVGDSSELARLSKRVLRVGWKTLSVRTGAIGRGDDRVDLTSPCVLLGVVAVVVVVTIIAKHQQTSLERKAKTNQSSLVA